MINGLILGRLGNQMFQYATLRALQEKYYGDEKINLDFSLTARAGKKEDGFVNQLGDFKLAPSKFVVGEKSRLSMRQKIMMLEYFAKRKIIKIASPKNEYESRKREFEVKMQKKYNENGLYIFSYGYHRFEKADTKNKLCMGFFESAKYFDGIREQLLDEFTPKQNELAKNKELYKKIRAGESVCISIRRGDFLSKEFKGEYLVCTEDYFEKAVALVKKKVKNPVFVVFSDDVKWVKENMKFPEGTLFETGDDPVWEKLRLMYNCRHFIISNSTFSWWAQYLSRNEKKFVVAPSRWRNYGYDCKDLYDEKWYNIDVQR